VRVDREPRGLEPTLVADSLRGAEAPLFHGGTGRRGGEDISRAGAPRVTFGLLALGGFGLLALGGGLGCGLVSVGADGFAGED
jgi:hypothetical protein